jgi:tetratricopeptide (TPR) repeat protein
MKIEIGLKPLLARLAFLAVALVVCAGLVVLIVSRFVIGTLTDERLGHFGRETLQVPVEYFPNSPRLNARLAEAEFLESDRNLNRAEELARKAIALSPYDYRYPMILASIKEAQGDRAAAEAALRDALKLAPNDRELHWRLANVLVRAGKLNDSLDDFRIAVAANKPLLPATLDLLWRASRGSVEALNAVTGEDTKARLMLAQFLVKQGAVTDAANVFRSLDRNARLGAIESAGVLNALVSAANYTVARELWLSFVAEDNAPVPLIWNGGFESSILKNFSQFDWTFGIGRNEYAKLSIDKSRAHAGTQSLKVEFLGRDTTRLEDELKQLVVVRPGARYRLEFYVKTENLVTPEGPRVAVVDKANTWIATSEPVAAGSNDWTLMAVEFVAPAAPEGASAVTVSIKRRPRQNLPYDDPTKGVIWFDDFTMKEQPSSVISH